MSKNRLCYLSGAQESGRAILALLYPLGLKPSEHFRRLQRFKAIAKILGSHTIELLVVLRSAKEVPPRSTQVRRFLSTLSNTHTSIILHESLAQRDFSIGMGTHYRDEELNAGKLVFKNYKYGQSAKPRMGFSTHENTIARLCPPPACDAYLFISPVQRPISKPLDNREPLGFQKAAALSKAHRDFGRHVFALGGMHFSDFHKVKKVKLGVAMLSWHR